MRATALSSRRTTRADVVNRCEGIAFAGGAAFSNEEGSPCLEMLPSLRDLALRGLRVAPEGAGAASGARVPIWVAAPWLVLAGVLALRAAVIFSAQS
jgi:hypothetical protein